MWHVDGDAADDAHLLQCGGHVQGENCLAGSWSEHGQPGTLVLAVRHVLVGGLLLTVRSWSQRTVAAPLAGRPSHAGTTWQWTRPLPLLRSYGMPDHGQRDMWIILAVVMYTGPARVIEWIAAGVLTRTGAWSG